MTIRTKAVPVLFLACCLAVLGGSDPPARPSIRLLSPNGGEVWAEGETHEIRWEAEGVAEVLIAVAVGGKDRGHLGEDGPIDGRVGRFAWTIPPGFVTGFGASRAGNVRIMIHDARDREVSDLSDGFFTITGPRPPSDEASPSPLDDDAEYEEAVGAYFDAISGRDHRRAYDMLSPSKVVLTNADGSAVAFQPRPDFERWREAQRSVRKIEVRHVERLVPSKDPERRAADPESALTALGIRMYKVTLLVDLSREDRPLGPGENTVFIYLVKGSDGRIRILEIGTGP